MADVKAKFHFASEALDSKTTIVKVKSIQLLDQPEVYLFPAEEQTNVQHQKLFDHAITKGVVRSLKTRNKFRKVVITLKTTDLKDVYLDEEGNVVFNGIYLEGVRTDIFSPPSSSQQTPCPSKSIHSIAKNMVLEKFNGKNFNAEEWLKTFTKECIRLDISEEKYAEVLRLFLEDSPSEWYSIFLKTNSLTHAWEFWNNSFLDTFNVKNWAEIAYAYNFKFLNGSFLDFALKKRNLLLDVDPKLTIDSQINLIVITLPKFIRSRLTKKDIVNIDSLMSVLKQIEPAEKKSNVTSNDKVNIVKPKSENQTTPCSYCEKKGFPNRFHAENVCRTKINDLKKAGNDKIRISNNAELQNSIALYDDAKNLCAPHLLD